jgi:ribosome-binding protein aMBF1 (putative translation factor)
MTDPPRLIAWALGKRLANEGGPAMEGRTNVKVTVQVGGEVMQEVEVDVAVSNGIGQSQQAGFLRPEPVQRAIGLSLSRAREKRGMTTTEIAKKIGISQAQVSRLENGKQGFRSYLLPRFAKALGQSIAVVCEPV